MLLGCARRHLHLRSIDAARHRPTRCRPDGRCWRSSASALTLFVAPRTNRIFYDEQIYQSIGQNLADLRLAQVCNDGSVEYGRLQCASGEYNKQPYAYPHAAEPGLPRCSACMTGRPSRSTPPRWALTVCAVYLLVCVLFRDRDAALFAGLLIALTPQQIMWSATAAVEPSASLASRRSRCCARRTICAVGGMGRARRWRRRGRVCGAVPPGVAADPAGRSGCWSGRDFGASWSVLAAGGRPFCFCGWWPCTSPTSSRSGTSTGERARRGSRSTTSPTNLRGERLVLSLRRALSRRPSPCSRLPGCSAGPFRRERLAMAIYFLLFFAIGLVFYAGSYNYGADVRYSLMTYPPHRRARRTGCGAGSRACVAATSARALRATR